MTLLLLPIFCLPPLCVLSPLHSFTGESALFLEHYVREITWQRQPEKTHTHTHAGTQIHELILTHARASAHTHTHTHADLSVPLRKVFSWMFVR